MATQPDESTYETAADELPVDEISSADAFEEVEPDFDTFDTHEILTIADPGAPPARRVRAELPSDSEITVEDRSFIHRVFNQVKDVDFRSAPPPPPRKNLAGLDKKMQFLRDRVRELERDLARVGWIWSIKQRQVDAVDQLLEAKETERAQAVERYTMLRDQAARSAQGFRDEEARLNALINEGIANASRLEGEMMVAKGEHQGAVEQFNSQLEAARDERQGLLNDFREKIEQAQVAFNQLRDASAQSIADSEARNTALRGEFDSSQADLASARQQLEELSRAVSERDTTIETANQDAMRMRDEHAAKVADFESQVAAGRSDIENLRGVLAEREKQLADAIEQANKDRGELETKLAKADEELSKVRAELEGKLAAGEDTLVQTRQELESKLAAAEEQLAQVRTELEGKLSAAESQLTDTGRGADELRTAIAERDAKVSSLTDELANAKNAIETAKAETSESKQQLEQQARETAGLKTDVTTLQRQLDDAEADLRRARDSGGDAEGRLADREGELMALREELRILRSDNERISRRLAEVDRGSVSSAPVDARTQSGVSEIKSSKVEP